MAFDHEQLDVYQLGLDFVALAERVIRGLPKGRSHLADQFTRSSISVVLNVAEGAGKFSKGDKRRYYLAARGSRQSRLLCSTSASDSRSPLKPTIVPVSRCSNASLRCS